jgi:hypothetical protein
VGWTIHTLCMSASSMSLAAAAMAAAALRCDGVAGTNAVKLGWWQTQQQQPVEQVGGRLARDMVALCLGCIACDE